jgi:hypothetical protein
VGTFSWPRALAVLLADASADPAYWTKQFSPADVALAGDAGWRAQAEFSATEPVESALFETPIGTLSDPFVLDGKLALAIVDHRRSAKPDARMLDRLTLDGYAAGLDTELSKATITRNSNPLPELATPKPSSSSGPTATPTEAQQLPTLPVGPAATPVNTDEFGLPVLR